MGLLARIEELQHDPHPQEDWELDNSYSKEEKTQILSEIDSVMERNRIQINAQTFVLKSRKKGWVFPLWVNLGSFLLLLLSFFVLRYTLGSPSDLDQSDPQTLLLTEARLLEEVRKESEMLVNQKNLELEEVRQQLKEIEDQKLEIQNRYELDLEALRSRLFSELELALEQEKERLRAQGFAEEEIERRLSEFRKQKEEEVENIIESEREALEEEKRRKEAELNQLYSQFSEELQNLEREKTELEDSYNQRLSLLRQEMEDRQNQTQQELSQAQQDLAVLAKRQEDLDRMKSQVAGFYASVQENLKNREYQDAINTLDLFQTFILEGSYLSVPEMAENRAQDLFLIQSLRSYAQNLQNPGNNTGDSVSSEEFSSRMDQAKDAMDKGDWEEALSAYSMALNLLPVEYGSSELMDNLTVLGWEKQREELQEEHSAKAEIWLETADNLSGNEEWENALNVYIEHLPEIPFARQWDRIPESMASIFQNWMNQEVDAQRQTLQPDNNAAREELERLTRINGELADEVNKERTERQILESTRAELHDQLVQSMKQNETLQNEIISLGDQIMSLQSQISQPVVNGNDQPAVNAEQARQIMELQNNITQMKQEIETYQTTEDLLNRISDSYLKYTRLEDSHLSDSTDSEALINAKGALNEFLEQEDMEELFPGFSERLRIYDRAFQQSGEKDITLELADYVFIYSTLRTPDEKVEWLNEQIRLSDTDEIREFFENLRIIATDSL